MKLRLLVEPNRGATYTDVLNFALEAERLGFDGFFCSDHYLAPPSLDGLPGPCDAWTTLAGLARETTSIRLGTLMSPVTFRLPGPLAIAVAQVDSMSGGRTEIGLGAGWYEEEHRAYGIPFPPTKTRFEQLEEQLTILTGLWTATEDHPFSFVGKHYRLEKSPGLPKPAQSPFPPILIGGMGKNVTPRLAASFAQEFNVPVKSPELTRLQFERVADACAAAGRERASIVFSAAQVVCVGENPAELASRASRIGRSVETLAVDGLAGTPGSVIDKVKRFAEAGAERLYLQFLDLDDLDHLRLVADSILPAVASL
jgi:F420-dependent oxidoreductase-like protein